MTEEWRDIEGYEGLYQVSNLGHARSIKHDDGTGRILGGRLLKPINAGNGYYRLHLSKGKQRELVCLHRVVASAFIPNPYNLPEINHIDENTANNSANNLEWCTHKHNINHGTRNTKSGIKHRGEKCFFAKLKEHEVLEIKSLVGKSCTESQAKELAKKYGISPQTIKHIAHERAWKWLKTEKEETE